MNELVSVIVPLFNTERYIAEALDSILNQGYSPIEVVVVDDGSADAGPEIVEAYGQPVRLIRQSNQGPGGARNTGIKHSTGNLLAFLDADDVWEADKLEIQLAAIRDDPTVDFVFGHAVQFQSPDVAADARSKFRFDEKAMPAHLPGSLLAKRESFLRVGYYPLKLVGSEIEWYLKARELDARIVTLPEVLYRRRLHDRNIGVVHRDSDRDRLAILKAALDRRRGSDTGQGGA